MNNIRKNRRVITRYSFYVNVYATVSDPIASETLSKLKIEYVDKSLGRLRS